MRELKFRAWDEINDVMWKDVLGDMEESDMYDDVTEMWEVAHQMETGNSAQFVFMQYTGNEDINGVEIYEGDIVQSEHYFKYQVVFKGDCWRCEPVKNNRLKNRFIGNDLKVIGNIYENPELLED